MFFIVSCSQGNGGTRANSTPDSGAVVTELTPGTDTAKGAAKSGAAASRDSSASLSVLPGPPKNAKASKEQAADFRCGITGGPVLTSIGIGNLQIGRTVDVVKRTCHVIRDEPEMFEGSLERVLTVLIDSDPVRVTSVSGLVWRLSIRSPRFATRDGLRIGTPLSRLAARGGVHLYEGEDGLYVTLSSHCGLSFRFSIPSRETPGKAWTVAHVVQRYGSAVTDRILVSRCAE
jgi:hypothetical protein